MALALAMTDPHTTLLLRRNAAELAVEDLINFLDDTAGDPDLEPAGDEEPWLGWPNAGQRITDEMALSADREEDGCGDEDTHDSEQTNEDGGDVNDEGEATNEDGGNVTDEPHDGGEDLEPDFRHHGASGHKAKQKLRDRRAQRKEGQGTSKGLFHGMDPRHLPPTYVMQVEGRCMEPEIRDGARVEFSSIDRPIPGDFVAIYRDAAFVNPGEWQVLVKRLVLDCRKGDVSIVNFGKGVMAEMLNPPQRLAWPAHEVIAVHKVTRILSGDESTTKMTAGEALALAAAAKGLPTVAVTMKVS